MALHSPARGLQPPPLPIRFTFLSEPCVVGFCQSDFHKMQSKLNHVTTLLYLSPLNIQWWDKVQNPSCDKYSLSLLGLWTRYSTCPSGTPSSSLPSCLLLLLLKYLHFLPLTAHEGVLCSHASSLPTRHSVNPKVTINPLCVPHFPSHFSSWWAHWE